MVGDLEEAFVLASRTDVLDELRAGFGVIAAEYYAPLVSLKFESTRSAS